MVLADFDRVLVARALGSLQRAGVTVKTDSIVKEVRPYKVVLQDGTDIKCGIEPFLVFLFEMPVTGAFMLC